VVAPVDTGGPIRAQIKMKTNRLAVKAVLIFGKYKLYIAISL
jgi:hypothetical protein